MRWLYLYFPQLQLDTLFNEREDPAHPSAPATPTIIVEPRHLVVCQLNTSAREKGLQTGMGLATASTLCHPLQVFSLDPALTRQRLQELAHSLYRVTAEIALFEPDGMVLEARSMLSLYGGLHAYLAQVNAVLETQSVHAIKTLAPTPLAGRLLAHSGQSLLGDDTDTAHQAIAQLELACLELPANQKKQLQRLGLNCLKDIEGIARQELGTRFGQPLIHYLDQIRGRRSTPLDFFQPEARFIRSLILEHEITHSTTLLFPVKNLLAHLAEFLRLRAGLIQNLTLTLNSREQAAQIVTLASAEPEQSAQNWLTLAQLKLERLQLKAPVIGLRLESGPLLDPDGRDQDLFQAHSQLSPAQLISRLQAKLGPEVIQTIEAQADYRPEYAFSYTASHQHKPKNQSRSGPDATLQSLRPTLLLEQPRALAEDIRIVHGPERIQTGWWSDHPVCRDYFVAINQKQQTLWVFRDEQQQWFVHGLFA